jgi:hypothetical protein
MVASFFDDLDANLRSYWEERPYMPRPLARGKIAKQLFARYADKNFLNSLVTIHWVKQPEKIAAILKNPSSRNDELSCNAVPSIVDIPQNGAFGKYGLVVKGRITFLANDMDDLYSGSYEDYVGMKDQIPYVLRDGQRRSKEEIAWLRNYMSKRAQTSGVNKVMRSGLNSVVLDANDFKYDRFNEALVDHWKPLAVVLPVLEPRDLEDTKSLFPDLFSGTAREVTEHLLRR